MNRVTSNPYLIAFLLTAILILSIYSNTIQASWHLDDMKNIVENPNIQIKILSLASIKNAIFSDPDNPGKIYRPLSCLTFAINAFFGRTDVGGYHIFNIVLHILSSAMLLILLNLSFKTPALESTPDEERHFIVIFSVLLWSINPIQTQAVTYIVQRMAMLSSFFSFFALVFFIKARLSKTITKKIIYFIITLSGILFSTLSKENGLITVLLILIFEYILFMGGLPGFLKTRKTFAIVAASILLLIAGCYLLGFNPFRLLNYTERTFTLTERVLTQPRVIIFYLSQIFCSSPQRLSIDHDIVFSTGLFSPPQTIISILTISVMLYIGIFAQKIHPLTRLALLFFLGGHIVESTFLPLEMIFEHRNYLPSALIFAPFVLFIFNLIKKYEAKKAYMRTAIAAFLSSVIFLFSVGTYIRNFDWMTEESLWRDAMGKAPNSARPKHNMGYIFETRGEYDNALRLYNEALEGFYHHKKYKADTFGNIGNIFSVKGEFKKAHMNWDKAIEINPEIATAHFAKTEGYIKEKKWEAARDFINTYKYKSPDNFFINKFESITNMHTGNFKEAILNINKCLRVKPNELFSLIRLAECLSLSGFYERTDFFLKICSIEHPNESAIYLAMAKNYYLNNMEDMARQRLQDYFRITGADNVNGDLKRISKTYELPMIGLDKMTDFIIKNFGTYKTSIILSKETLL